MRGADLARAGPRRSPAPRPRSSPCRPSAAAPPSRRTSFLISPWAMSSASRISASVTPLAPASTIRIASSVPATIRSSSSSSWRLLGRVDDEVAVELADPDRADVRGDRDRRDRQRRGGAVHREDVVGVDLVDRHRHRDQLGLVVPALGEERADRPVDHARGQRRLLAGFALATEERAGDLARGVHALLDVDGEGKEVHVAQVADGRGAEDHRVAGLDHDRATRLLREFAGLEGNLAVADVRRDAGYVKHAHLVVLPPAARLAAIRFQNSRSLTAERVQASKTPPGRAGRHPARMPDSKSRRTRAATSLGAAIAPRSARDRARGASTRSQRCGSSTWPRSA